MMDLQPWFEAEDYRLKPSYRELSETQQRWVDQYRKDGYLVLDHTGISPETMDEVVAQLQGKYTHAATGYDEAGRLLDGWQSTPAVRRIAIEPTILAALQTLYQKQPLPFQTLNFERGTQQRAHSDTIHFNTLPFGFMCGVWVALEDIDRDNGPLFYLPGSQRLPVFHMEDLGLKSEGSEYQKYEDCVGKILADGGFRPQQALLKRGQALIWSANIFHGGSKVLDPTRTRLSQVTHYYFPGCIFYTPLLSSPREQRWRLRELKNISTLEVFPAYEGLPRRKRRHKILAKIPLLNRLARGNA